MLVRHIEQRVTNEILPVLLQTCLVQGMFRILQQWCPNATQKDGQFQLDQGQSWGPTDPTHTELSEAMLRTS